MPAFSLAEVVAATHARLVHESPVRAFAAVSTDTRALEPGALFVALKGERFDGHEFVAEAVKWGAAGALVSQKLDTHTRREFALLRVPDTQTALGDLARHHRRKFELPVIAVTGSVGKTTTKEMVSCILRSQVNTLSATESYNNEIGVPLTLLRLDSSHKAAVLELAMRGRGQIAYLADLARPTLGVITNIGDSHLELLGSREAVADAKGELLAALPRDRFAVLNRDDEFFDRLAARAPNVVACGFDDRAQMRASRVEATNSGAKFLAHYGCESFPVELRVPGRHNVRNALAALAAAVLIGMKLAEAARALREFEPPVHRLRVLTTSAGITILDDCYNASPASVAAALEVAREREVSGRRVLVFGDMKELGARSEEAHREVGKLAARAGIQVLIAVGDLAQQAAREAQRRSPQMETIFCDAPAEALLAARAAASCGDLVLVKASRAMKLEEVVDGLLAN